jgi:hypothetical protein
VLLDGTRIKTLPSRLGVTELARLASSGARPAGPSPLLVGSTAVIEVDRAVNAAGLISALATSRSASACNWPGSGSPWGWKDR